MGAKGSVYPRHLLGIQPDGNESEWGVVDGSAYVPWSWTVDTVAGTDTYYVFNAPLGAPGHGRVRNCRVTLLGAPGAGDQVTVQKVSGGVTTNVTDTMALATFADTDLVDCSQINDANCDFQPGDTLKVYAESDVLVRVELDLAWRT